MTIEAATRTTIATCIQIQKGDMAADPIDTAFTRRRCRCL
jgi:hypothetical protein